MTKLMRLKELMPDYYDDVLEMNTLLNVEQFQVDELMEAIDRQADNQFVMTADKKGLEVWESLVGISRNPYYDVETRRYDILAKMLPKKPITIRYLRSLLKTLNINADIKVEPNQFHVTVTMQTTDPNAARRLQGLLSGILPANLTFTALNYNVDSPYQQARAGVASINAVKYTNKGDEKNDRL